MGKDKSFDPTGALPDPEVFKQYEAIAPGAAKLIFDAFAEESKHRREQERKALEAQINDKWRGQVFGLVIGLAAIGAGALTAILGAGWPGGLIGSAGVVGLVSVFVVGHLWSPPDPK
jgi:uncharacterized membrane protein